MAKKKNKAPVLDVLLGSEVAKMSSKKKAPKRAKLAAKNVVADEKYLVVRTETPATSTYNILESALEFYEEVEDKYGALEENSRVMLSKKQCVEVLQEALDEKSNPAEYAVYKLTPVKISLSPRVVSPATVKVN